MTVTATAPKGPGKGVTHDDTTTRKLNTDAAIRNLATTIAHLADRTAGAPGAPPSPLQIAMAIGGIQGALLELGLPNLDARANAHQLAHDLLGEG